MPPASTAPRRPGRSRRIAARLPVLGWAVVATLVVLPRSLAPTAPADAVLEEEAQAKYIYFFAKFVAWPASAHESKSSPIVIGILGVDPFGSILDDAVEKRYAWGREIRIVRYPRHDRTIRCHILFVASSESRRYARVVKALAPRPILTVSDIPDFARQGGMIEFVRDGSRLRMVIHRSRAERAGLRIHSKLLRIAEVLTDPEEK